MVTQERLKELFTCDWDTGRFTRLVNVGRKVKAGQIAGSLKSDGYRAISIDGKTYKEHRLAWLYFFGEFPEHQLDHIDGNKINNGLDNLREATAVENGRNQKIPKNNTSGYKGVSWSIKAQKFISSIRVNGEFIYLGSFDSAEVASSVYEAKAKEVFGEFYKKGAHASTN